MKTKMLTGMVYSVLVLFIVSCGGSGGSKTPPADPNDPMQNKGIGPVKSVTLGELDPAMAAEGEKIYKEMCSACHKIGEKFIGPAPNGILQRRSPEWIMNMILNPEKMIVEDPVAKKLLVEYNLAPMANQHLTEEQARKILEYFRTLK
jgi:mono/diheme cytochrome c family protein